jgi:prepilin-type N-terminal cleavage/methylation domain-containing protein
MKDTMAIPWKQSGFNIIELMVTLAIFAIAASVAAPNLQRWMRNYRLKSAVMELHSNMQFAKLNAVKSNRSWQIQFDTSGTYSVIQCLTATCSTGTLNTDYRVSKTVSFATAYGNEIVFNNPQSTIVFERNPLIFDNIGATAQPGYVYISNRINSVYYRIGTEFIAGNIRIQRWDGSIWK